MILTDIGYIKFPSSVNRFKAYISLTRIVQMQPIVKMTTIRLCSIQNCTPLLQIFSFIEDSDSASRRQYRRFNENRHRNYRVRRAHRQPAKLVSCNFWTFFHGNSVWINSLREICRPFTNATAAKRKRLTSQSGWVLPRSNYTSKNENCELYA